MQLYLLFGYEDSETLTHDKKFSQEEFKKMCQEAPRDEDWYDSDMIAKYLVKKHGFKKADYVADFFTDKKADGEGVEAN